MSGAHRARPDGARRFFVVASLVAVVAGGYGVVRLSTPAAGPLRPVGDAGVVSPSQRPPTGSPWQPPPTDTEGQPIAAEPAAAHPGSAHRDLGTPAERATRILARLDRVRAAAWRSGRPALLRRVWASGTSGLARDVAMLRAWTSRGLRVDRVSLRLSRLVVVETTGHRLVLRTADRLRPASAWAVGQPAGLRRLPRDQPSRHLITLVRTGHGWRLAGVETLETSRS